MANTRGCCANRHQHEKMSGSHLLMSLLFKTQHIENYMDGCCGTVLLKIPFTLPDFLLYSMSCRVVSCRAETLSGSEGHTRASLYNDVL